MEAQAIEPAVGVLQRLFDRGPAELLVVGRVAVGGQALVDKAALFVGKEL